MPPLRILNLPMGVLLPRTWNFIPTMRIPIPPMRIRIPSARENVCESIYDDGMGAWRGSPGMGAWGRTANMEVLAAKRCSLCALGARQVQARD